MSLLRRLASLGQGGKTAARASVWSAAGYGVSTVLRFVSRLVLAKLISDATPMGDVATVVVILAGLEMISDLGTGVLIVQHKRGSDREFLGTAYSVQALRGVGIWLIACLIAQPVALVYHDPELFGLLLFGALSTLFRSFANPGVWILTRNVDLRGPTLLTVGSEVTGFVVTIAWALVAPSAWAIVGGTVAASAAYAAFSHLLGERARFSWNPQMARQITRFGGWMLLSSGTYFLSSRGEILLLRGSVTDLEFGCFAFASMLVTTPLTAVTQLASQVLFPTVASSIREDPQRAESQFRRSKWAFTALALCFAWGGMFIGPVIIDLLKLNETFVGLTWMVQLLGLRAAMDIYCAPTGTLLFAFGASRYSAWANVVRLIILVAGLYYTTARWGLEGAFWVLVCAPMIAYLALLPGMYAHMPSSLRIEAKTGAVLIAGVLLTFLLGFQR